MNDLEIKTAVTGKELGEFIRLPYILHKEHANWLPPIRKDEWNYFNPKHNRAFGYCDTTLALALRGNQVAGRIMGIINHRHNTVRNEKTARFSHFECINDPAVAHELLRSVEEWANGLGMTRMIGPFGLTYHDPMGFMTEGFDRVPAVSSYSNFEYILPLVEKEGYSPGQDLVVYKIPIGESVPPLHLRIHRKAAANPHLKTVRFRTRKDLRSYIFPVLSLMNETFETIFGYSDIDETEMKILAAHYLPVLDPRFVKVVEYDGEVAGFMIGMPNITKGLRAANGRLFPFGFISILNARRKSRQLDLLIGGIREKYRGIGIDVLLGTDMINSARESGFEFIDTHLELESNVKVRAEMEKLGGVVYKRYRIFEKALRIS
jgi:hypothetical protein